MPDENGSNYTNFIHVVECPNNDFPKGSHFDRASFAATLQDGYFPNGMIVMLYAKTPRLKDGKKQTQRTDFERWIKCMVYHIGHGTQYLHECADDDCKSLREDGLRYKTNGTTTPNLEIWDNADTN